MKNKKMSNRPKQGVERVARFFLYFLSIAIASIGLMYIFNPDGSMEAAKISILSAEGRTEVRGMYGGLHFALAVYILLSTRAGLQQAALLLVALVFGCVALGRIVGFVFEGEADLYNLLITSAEIVISSMALVLFRACAGNTS